MGPKLKKFLARSLIAALALPPQLTAPAFADDTDIYAADTGATTNPNILVVIDNSANWAANNQGWPNNRKQGQSELSALRTVISELGSDVNLGLMLFTPGSGSNEDGAYVRYHVRQMTAANKSAFQELLGDPAGCTDGANSLNGTPNCIYQNFSGGALNESVGTAKTDYSASLFEVFKYFGGYTNPANALTNTAGAPVDASHYGALRYAGDPDSRSDTAAYSGGASLPNYNTPVSSTNSCAKNYVIFIGNGYPTQDSPSSLLTGVGGSATQLSVPDFSIVSGTSQSLLATSAAGTYATQAECEAAAAATYGASYTSYSCAVAGTAIQTAAFGTSSCGQYGSQAACETAIAAANPGYTTYSCAVAANCAGNNSLGTSACGQYASVAECEAGAATAFPGYASYSCAVSASTCTPGSASLGTTTCGQYATASACQTAAAAANPGYTSYTCTSAGSCTSADLDGAACYASSATCQSSVLAANPGYNSVACSSATNCTSAVATTCAAANTYNNAASCNAGAPALLGGTYATYTCDAGANCASGKTWTITGTNQSYTAVGTGTRWNVTGSTPAGTRYDMTGVGGGSTYTMTGSRTLTSWNIYGTRAVTSAVPTGTYTGTSSNYADEWARFLYQTDINSATGQQNISTYTIDVYKDQQDADETKLLMSMAKVGGGKYFSATDEDSIKNALRQIFSEIQSVNSVFASSSLPVSVNTQGTYLNQVFVGMFRPDGGAKPRWPGNLKQYKFARFSGALRLADKNSNEAISSTTGFITPCASSFWTSDTGNYWQYGGSNATGSCTSVTSSFPSAGSSSAYSDAPDGDVVEKGGAAQRLRGVQSSGGTLTASSTRYSTCSGADTPETTSCRKLYTCVNSSATSCTEFTNFDTSNAALTAATFGVPTDADRDLLIQWVRGKDVDEENGNAEDDEVRPSVHGGVVHSQPAVVDYGGTTGVIAYYGGDDGVLHAIDGGSTDTEGTELWGFIAPETLSRLARLRDNSPLISYPTVSMALTPTPTAKGYFFDGSIAVHQSGSTVWIYPTMRRGGRAIYAFDVSTPTAPAIKWRRGCFTNSTSDDSSCSTGWTGIGQTWSKPQVTLLSGFGSTPVLVFGAGYDTCEDTDSQTRCAGTRKGAGIWFVNADTGAILRTYPTNYSVPGDVFVIKDDSGNATRVYAADTGGYVYRIDVGSVNAAGTTFTGWTANSAATDTAIASLSSADNARKFINGPDVVQYKDYNAVLIGSGDREHPLATQYACVGPVTNMFYMLKDTTARPSIVLDDLLDVTSTPSPTQAALDAKKGWRFDLAACEQVVNKALTLGGTTYFGTNTPTSSAPGSCTTNLGTARGYAVNFLSGAPVGDSRSTTYIGGGMPPSPVGGIVEIGDERVPFIIGGTTPGDPNPSPLQGTEVNISPTGSRYRVYWYLTTD